MGRYPDIPCFALPTSRRTAPGGQGSGCLEMIDSSLGIAYCIGISDRLIRAIICLRRPYVSQELATIELFSA